MSSLFGCDFLILIEVLKIGVVQSFPCSNKVTVSKMKFIFGFYNFLYTYTF